MTLIAILVALGVERLLGQLAGWGRPVIYLAYVRGALAIPIPLLWRSVLAPWVLVLAPVALVWWLVDLLANPFLQLFASSIVLLLCLGPRDLADDVQRLLEARARGDDAQMQQLTRALQMGPQPEPSHRSLIGALFIQSHERLFSVLLWYFAFGAAGALAYRLASRLPRMLQELQPDSPAVRSAELLHNVLAWLPARLTALIFGLAGSLDDALKEWWKLMTGPVGGDWRARTWAILAEVSAASLRMEEPDGSAFVPATLDACLAEVLRMQWRAALLLLALFAWFFVGTIL
ncbi:MAG TPA: regulatory signaling modulator protein AmpE [Solimonas sp.]|nr:regulatory signaling modulator protein AmpE [Solimonas sp.]